MKRWGIELSVFNTIIQKTAVQYMAHTHAPAHADSHSLFLTMMIIAHIALTRAEKI